MKRITIIIGMLALGCVSSQALWINVIEGESDKLTIDIAWRTDLPVDEWWWGDGDRSVDIFVESGLYGIVGADDLGEISIGSGQLTSQPVLFINVSITFPDYPHRLVEEAIITGADQATVTFNQDNWLRLAWDLSPDVAHVPDAGSTVGLLGLALGGLTWAGRRMRK